VKPVVKFIGTDYFLHSLSVGYNIQLVNASGVILFFLVIQKQGFYTNPPRKRRVLCIYIKIHLPLPLVYAERLGCSGDGCPSFYLLGSRASIAFWGILENGSEARKTALRKLLTLLLMLNLPFLRQAYDVCQEPAR